MGDGPGSHPGYYSKQVRPISENSRCLECRGDPVGRPSEGEATPRPYTNQQAAKIFGIHMRLAQCGVAKKERSVLREEARLTWI